MDTTHHIIDLLDDYLDDTLQAADRTRVQRHLVVCKECRLELDHRMDIASAVGALPRAIPPPVELWGGIAARLNTLREDRPPQERSSGTRSKLIRPWMGWVAAACVLAVVGRLLWPASTGWQVEPLAGIPLISDGALSGAGRLQVGEWIETDAASSARLEVGSIGTVDIGPGTRIQLQEATETDHRLVLEEGQIEAFIWAPPRLFFVETPAALATDLGCAYTLTVDSVGVSLLHVTSGYVELERHGRAVLVPAGAMCRAHPEQGPGTAFSEEASPALREALQRFDFEQGGEAALLEILEAATPADAITLWQLLPQVDAPMREAVYDRLITYETPPFGVTREGILALDPDEMATWARWLGWYVE